MLFTLNCAIIKDRWSSAGHLPLAGRVAVDWQLLRSSATWSCDPMTGGKGGGRASQGDQSNTGGRDPSGNSKDKNDSKHIPGAPKVLTVILGCIMLFH